MEAWKRLQPLRIPAGWTVMFHEFSNTDPETFRKNHPSKK